ncbi:hypothetical protein J6590_002803 [Homalodisca vitripennis]|nr:hypothetical protein J6590_002803 [Homalodisca vitripennis]
MPSAWLGISAVRSSASPVSARRRSVPRLLPPFPRFFYGSIPSAWLGISVVRSSASPVSARRRLGSPPVSAPAVTSISSLFYGSMPSAWLGISAVCGLVHPQPRLAVVHLQSRFAAGQCPGCYLHFLVVLWFIPSAWLGISAMESSASPVSARRRSVPWLLPPFPCCFMVPCRLHGSGSVQCGLVHPQSRHAVVSARRRSVPRLLPPFPCCFMVPCRLHGSGSVQCAV